MINFLEHDLSEYLDDLLVTAKIEQPRTKKHVASVDEYADGFVNFKMAPRVQITFELTDRADRENCIVIKYHGEKCNFSLVTGKPMANQTPAHIAKVVQYVQQMMADKKCEIIKACREELDYRSWKRAQKKDHKDALPCDGFWVEKEHVLGARKRPWLEQKQSKGK